jgi:hypothetical protein
MADVTEPQAPPGRTAALELLTRLAEEYPQTFAHCQKQSLLRLHSHW